ncbi:hypothetical protein BD769DRAFT_1676361 [Suillus cothurnatus]|nr:hypothetical protein BD769DRAFT_1676361 [Suillus cothurnatus]
MGICQSQPRAKILLGNGNTDSISSLSSLDSSSFYSLEEHVPLKPKAIDHFLDSCEQPTHRRHTFWNGKDQFSQDPIHPNLLQAQTLFFVHGCSKSSVPKKHTLCCMYVIEDLSVQGEGPPGGPLRIPVGLEHNASITKPCVRAKRQLSEILLKQQNAKRKVSDDVSGGSFPIPKRCAWSQSRSSVIADPMELTLGTKVSVIQAPSLCWPFPNELVLKILKDMPSRDLQAIMQVSCLSWELAAPLYLHSINLLFNNDTLRISTQYLRCNLLYADDCHLQVLLNFMELLGSNSSLFVSIVKDGEMLGDFAPLFQYIRDSGCRSDLLPLWRKCT